VASSSRRTVPLARMGSVTVAVRRTPRFASFGMTATA
jgi:hypothetical protein